MIEPKQTKKMIEPNELIPITHFGFPQVYSFLEAILLRHSRTQNMDISSGENLDCGSPHCGD